MIKEESLIRFKTTQSITMDYVLETGSILLTLIGQKKDLETPLYVIEIPKNKVFQVSRGLETYKQRYYRKKK